MKKVLIIIFKIVAIVLIGLLLVYLIPFKRNYKTKLGYTIEVPLISKIEEVVDHIEENDDNVKIMITSYQSPNSVNIINNFVKDFKIYINEFGTKYYYNTSHDFTIRIDSIKKKKRPVIELTLIKGNKYERVIEDNIYYNQYKHNILENVRIEGDDSGLVKVYKNIYKYNIETLWISYYPKNYNHNYHYTIEDIFKYNYYKIDDFINTYEEIEKINYAKKIEGKDYILYTPAEVRMYGQLSYSILICNDKYIFGDRNLEYDKRICEV